jgi:signal transduction histidine kinase
MKNKIEFKKAIFICCLVIIVILVIFQIGLFYQYRAYTNNFNNKIEAILTNVESKYPNIDKNELMEIINTENSVKTGLLEEYGINLKNDSVILQNNRLFTIFSIVNIVLIIVLSVILLIVFIKYNMKKDKKLLEITRYIEEINSKNYKLDIEDNTEDELSILKNEIYKTTVMLKEVAENSAKDKANLKDSLSDISHQLKTPLTSISVMVDNLIDNPQMDTKTRDEFIKDIRREIININFLVNSLLKLSKLDANSVYFINKEVAVNNIIEEAIKNVAVLCDLKNVSILVSGDKTITIKCDLKWQVEAITNILKNCVEHSYENSNIEISFEENNVYTKIDIKDYGTGIDKDDMPHIFERFYKGKNSSSESVGIGLALSKSIIESNNGYIGVESELEHGSLFTIKYFK